MQGLVWRVCKIKENAISVKVCKSYLKFATVWKYVEMYEKSMLNTRIRQIMNKLRKIHHGHWRYTVNALSKHYQGDVNTLSRPAIDNTV